MKEAYGKRYKVATIAGDGIGLEVLPEGIKVVKAAAEKYGIDLQLDAFDWASCDYYLKHGKMMPDDWFETLQGYDAIYFGAVGWPDKVPDHISLWGSLLQFRRGFDQYVNLRPVRLMPGVKCPLVGKNRAISTSTWFVKIVKVNTQRLAVKLLKVQTASLFYKKPYLHVMA